MNNIFAVYKPKGPSSFDMVRQVKKITGEKRVGHAGTLDPLACGILVIGVGRKATKRLNKFVQKEKEYIARIKFGAQSQTDDEEGKKKEFQIKKIPDEKEIKKVIKKFIGEIKQTPPIYSAVKIKGRAAYKYARKNLKLELEPRLVFIKDIKILDYDWPKLKIKVITGPGVYIRALARDIGRELDVGGYLADLERTRVGQFIKEKTLKLEEINKNFAN